MGTFVICAAVYVAGAVCVGLGLSYYEARYSRYSTDADRLFKVYGWPLIAMAVVLIGPFMLAEELGNRARIKSRDTQKDTHHGR